MSAKTVDRKVMAGAAVGGLVSFLAWLIDASTGVTMSADAGIGLTAALTFVVQYFVPNKETSDDSSNSDV